MRWLLALVGVFIMVVALCLVAAVSAAAYAGTWLLYWYPWLDTFLGFE